MWDALCDVLHECSASSTGEAELAAEEEDEDDDD